MQKNIMWQLGVYKYLTYSQMLRLSIASHTTSISKAMTTLKRHKWLRTAEFSVTQRTSGKVRTRKVESFFYLTTKGAKKLAEMTDIELHTIKYVAGTTVFSGSYFHRKYAIDCEIEARIHAEAKGYETVIFDRDFDRTGSNRKGKGFYAKTRIASKGNNYIIPDGNFVVAGDDDQRLFTFELHHTKSKKEIVRQLLPHVDAVENGSIGVKYDIPKLHRVLNVFVSQAKMQAVVAELSKAVELQGMEQFFYFKTLDEVKTGLFYNDWLNLEGQRFNLLA